MRPIQFAFALSITLFAFASQSVAAPPKVAKATPDNGAKDVDPGVQELRVTFDQAMQQGGMSWVGGGPEFPNVTGKGHWIDDHTCVLPVKLEPEHKYRLSINNNTFKNFRNKNGDAAVPYPIAFETAPDKNAPSLTPEQNRKAIDGLRKAIDENYAYRDLKKLDWGKLFQQHQDALEKATTPKKFADEAAKLLAAADDMHVWLKVGSQTIPSKTRSVPPNWNLQILPKLTGWKQQSSCVWTGRFKDIPYIMISTWGDEKGLDAAYAALGDASAAGAKQIIIDVRENAGGDEGFAQQFAGCFIDEPKPYAKNRNLKDGKWSGPFERIVQPNRARPQFRGKVAVLMGKANMSSCESFLLMMKQSADCKLIGATSYGSSGNPKPNDLGNGVVVFLASWEDQLLDGTTTEGVGIKPDIEVSADPKDYLKSDPVLEAAGRWLEGT